MGKKILLIADHPDTEFETGNGSTGREVLHEIVSGLFNENYEVLIEEDPSEGEELIKEDKEIEVVLCGINFYGNPLGRAIVQKIEQLNPKIRVVMLTAVEDHGMQIVFGQLRNVWYYFIKRNLRTAKGRIELKNIVTALLEDPFNKKWSMTFDGEMVSLDHPVLCKPITVGKFNVNQAVTLEHCLHNINKCCDCRDIEGKTANYNLALIVNQLNNLFVHSTGFKTWGFLDSKRCPANSLKIVIS
jgi:CheY-like chemotaxis protein